MSETDDQIMGSMHMDADIRGRIDNYLAEADAALARRGVPSIQRRSVEISLRNRILGALRGHPSERNGSLDVEAVLTSLGPPGKTSDAEQLTHTASGLEPAFSTESINRSAKLSWLAVIGAIWAIIFFVVLAVAAVSPDSPTTATRSSPFAAVIAFLMRMSWSAPLAATVLGLIALERIRRSNGRQYGLSLALFDVVLFPLLMINILIILTCGRISEVIAERQWMSSAISSALIGQILPAVACILASYWVATRAWAALSKAPPRRRSTSLTSASRES